MQLDIQPRQSRDVELKQCYQVLNLFFVHIEQK